MQCSISGMLHSSNFGTPSESLLLGFFSVSWTLHFGKHLISFTMPRFCGWLICTSRPQPLVLIFISGPRLQVLGSSSVEEVHQWQTFGLNNAATPYHAFTEETPDITVSYIFVFGPRQCPVRMVYHNVWFHNRVRALGHDILYQVWVYVHSGCYCSRCCYSASCYAAVVAAAAAVRHRVPDCENCCLLTGSESSVLSLHPSTFIFTACSARRLVQSPC